jgi:putative CocE/NonD family hydrolase
MPATLPESAPRVWRDVMIAMRDGVHLATDIYLPPEGDGPFPVLLERTPYDKTGTNHADRSLAAPSPVPKPAVAAGFARAGYAYVLQDCRGRYASGGDFEKYVAEGEDGFDTIAWLAVQCWCDGRVGTLGLSYGAHVQTALAALTPPALGAMFLESGGFSSAYHSGIRQGGAFELKQLTWAYKHALLAPQSAADPARRNALMSQDLRSWMRVQPWRVGHSPLSAAPEYEQYVAEQWREELFSDYWRRPALYGRGHYASFPDVPMVHMSSWYDPYAMTAIENYSGLSRIKRSPVRLVLGPWTHGQRSVTYAGDVDFGPHATLDRNIAPDYSALRQAWFDRHLRGIDAPDYLPAPVKLFVMGGGSGRKNAAGRLDHGGRWRDEADWPPPAARAVPFYLHASGLLTTTPSADADAALAYDHDPLHPVPTIGGAIASGAPVMAAGGFDQRESATVFGATEPYRALAERDDVLVLQTEPLERAVEVTGCIVAHLWVSSSARDTDFTIKLVDVYPPSDDYPDGCAINLAHGILRMRFRDGFERSALMEPDATYAIQIQAFPTSNLFAAGHRIRLDIASSNFPHFDVNPNTGAPAGQPSAPVVAHNRVYMDRSRPSHIVLPLVGE